jgi:hypothetical protein
MKALCSIGVHFFHYSFDGGMNPAMGVERRECAVCGKLETRCMSDEWEDGSLSDDDISWYEKQSVAMDKLVYDGLIKLGWTPPA